MKKQKNEEFDIELEDDGSILIKVDDEDPIDLEIDLEEDFDDNEVQAEIEKAQYEYRGSDVTRMYLNDIGKKERIDYEEEKRLTKLMMDGKLAKKQLSKSKNLTEEQKALLETKVQVGEKARERVIEANYRLVVANAKKYLKGGKLEFIDLIQDGNMGLIKAVDKFDPYKGYRLSTYATWWIRQAITRGIAEKGRTIRLPVNMIELSQKLRKIANEYRNDHGGKKITDEELAKISGEELKKIKYLRRIETTMVSLQAKVGDDDGNELQDMIPDYNYTPEKEMIKNELDKKIEEVMNKYLTQREREIVKMRKGFEDESGAGKKMTLEEVSKKVGLTKERVRQIEKAAINKLRRPDIQEEIRSLYVLLNKNDV